MAEAIARSLADPSTRATASGRGLAQDSAPSLGRRPRDPRRGIPSGVEGRAQEKVPRTLPVGLHGRWDIWSAGSRPSGSVHPLAMRMMAELGLDLATHRSKGLSEVPARRWDYVVTMGCGDNCPSVNAVHRIDWAIPDPVGLPLEEVRRIRDEITGLVRGLLAETSGI